MSAAGTHETNRSYRDVQRNRHVAGLLLGDRYAWIHRFGGRGADRAVDFGELFGRRVASGEPADQGVVRLRDSCVAHGVETGERITDDHQPLLSAHAPRTLAAAVQRLVAYRASGRAAFAEAAAAYRVPEEEVRRADRAVRRLLALGPAQPW